MLNQRRTVPNLEGVRNCERLPVQMDTLDQQVPQQAAPFEPAAPAPGDLAVLNQMLVTLVESKGSDLHLTVGSPPMIRVNGSLRALPGYGKLNSADTALELWANNNCG